MASVLILSYSHISSDPRVLKQVDAFKSIYALDIAAYSCEEEGINTFIPIHRPPSFSIGRKIKRYRYLKTKDFEGWYWDAGKEDLLKRMEGKTYDVIIANDIHTLPLALRLANDQTKVFFDAHEYHPEEFTEDEEWSTFQRPYMEYLCTTYIPQVDAFATVNESLAESYKTLTGIQPEVVMNTSPFVELEASQTKEIIRMIHHGAAIRSRKIEDMIAMVGLLDDRFTMDLMLVGSLDESYYQQLQSLCQDNPRVNLIEPVSLSQIVGKLNGYDIGVYILPPSNFNNEHALPNKIFEFIQARLAIAISPNKEMKRMVEEHELGVVADGFTVEGLANAINALSIEQINTYKANSAKAAETLSSETSIEKYRSLVKRILAA